MIDKPLSYTSEQFKKHAQLTTQDLRLIGDRRRNKNKLGFAYLLVHVRLFNRFPRQQPFEVINDIVRCVALQLDIFPPIITAYSRRRETLTEHQEIIRNYLGLKRFPHADQTALRAFIFQEACRLEQSHALQIRLKEYLKQQRILEPADDTLERLIRHERTKANQFIFEKIASFLSELHRQKIDDLLVVQLGSYSDLHRLKQTPQSASPSAALKLISKLKEIKDTGILAIDLSWLNNNFQRSLAKYTKHCTVSRLRNLNKEHRYAALTCFLHQLYLSTIDDLIIMYDRIMTSIETKADEEIDRHFKARRNKIKGVLASFHAMSRVFLDDNVPDEQLRSQIFKTISRESLNEQMTEIDTWLSGKHSHRFNLVVSRFSYLRQFTPQLLEQLDFEQQNDRPATILEAVKLLRNMNREGKRKLLTHPPIDFLPKAIQALVKKDGAINKPAWECAMMMAVRDEIKAGNLAVCQSKRFVPIHEFFMPEKCWAKRRSDFFARAGLPEDPTDVPAYLTTRLNKAFDDFLKRLPENTYATLGETGWQLSRDPAEKLSKEAEVELAKLEGHLRQKMRIVKLPELLIEVDNELQFTRRFMTATQQDSPKPANICAIIATVMAHGCNIGPYTMAHLTQAHEDACPVLDNLLRLVAYESTYYDKITASLLPLLNKLTTARLLPLLSPQADKKNIDWATVVADKQIVYVGLDALSNKTVAAAVGNALLADLVSLAGRLYKADETATQPLPRICLHVDEFNDIIGDEFIPLLNKARGVGFQVTAYTQTRSDVEARLNSRSKAEQVAGNFNTLVMLRVKDVKTAEQLLSGLPLVPFKTKLSVTKQQLMPAVAKNAAPRLTSLNDERLEVQTVPLLSPPAVLHLPKGEAFALLDGGKLIKFRVPIIRDDTDLPVKPRALLIWLRDKTGIPD